MQEAEVAASNPGNGCGGPMVGEVRVIQLQTELAPVAGEHEGQLITLQGPVVMGEADPAIELRVAFQFAFQAGHADQDDADAGAVEDIADLFEALGREMLGLVDDKQFDAVLVHGFQTNPAGVERQVDAPLDVDCELTQIITDFPDRAADSRRVESRPCLRERILGDGIGRIAWTPCQQKRFGLVPLSEAPGGHDFPNTGRAEADADIAVLLHSAGKFDAPAVFLGGNEGAGTVPGHDQSSVW